MRGAAKNFCGRAHSLSWRVTAYENENSRKDSSLNLTTSVNVLGSATTDDSPFCETSANDAWQFIPPNLDFAIVLLHRQLEEQIYTIW